MHQKFPFLLLFAFLLTLPAAYAQQGNNGVWTSTGHDVWNNGSAGAQAVSPSAKTLGAPQNNAASAPSVSSVDVVYDNAEKIELLKITGTNFSQYKEKVRVTIDGAPASIVSSDPTRIMAVLPSGLGSMPKVSVEINGQVVLRNKKLPLPPQVTGISLLSAPPGMPLTIYGTRFAPVLADNKVTIGGTEAHVNGGSETALMVVIPTVLNMGSPSWGLPVVVQVHGLNSNSDVGIRIQNRVY